MEYTRSNNITDRVHKANAFHFTSYLNHIVWIILFFAMAQALINDDEMLMSLSVMFTIGYCFIAKSENVFYILCGMTMFESVFKIGGDIVWFVPLLILALKLLYRDKYRFNSGTVFSLLLIFCLELLLDLTNESMGQLLVNLITIVFVFVAFPKISILKLNAFNIIFSLLAAFSAVIYYLLSMYGGIGEYISSFMSATYAYRFGHSYGDTIGGAMAIPLYTTMIISCGLTCYLKADRLNFIQKVIIFFAAAISTVFGAMTISRSFYLGLIVTIIAILLFKSQNKKFAKGILLFLVLVAIIFLVSSNSDIINKIFSNLQLRLDNGMNKGSEGRTDIWISCIGYLLEHPLNLLFGFGATNYINIGAQTGELFAAGAHNLFIDFLMSWGMVGSAILIAFLISVYNRQKNNARFNSQSLIPLITYVFFAMTALRSCSLKTWIFLLIAFAFINESVYREERERL